MMLATEHQKPGEYQRSHDVTVAPTLEDLGITKWESSEAQKADKLSIKAHISKRNE